MVRRPWSAPPAPCARAARLVRPGAPVATGPRTRRLDSTRGGSPPRTGPARSLPPRAPRFCMDDATPDPTRSLDGQTRSQPFQIRMFPMTLLRDVRGEIGGSRTIYRSDSERSEGGGAQRVGCRGDCFFVRDSRARSLRSSAQVAGTGLDASGDLRPHLDAEDGLQRAVGRNGELGGTRVPAISSARVRMRFALSSRGPDSKSLSAYRRSASVQHQLMSPVRRNPR
jgi:hypothetical protein